jgi:predicted HTH transcriptional regulator
MAPSRFDPHDLDCINAIEFIRTRSEGRNVEYKGPCVFDDIRPHIVKTSIGMSNLRGGGYIIIGIGKVDDVLTTLGVDEVVARTYDPDKVLTEIAKYTSPPVNAVVGIAEHNKRDFVVIAVREFDRTPVVTKREGSWEKLKQHIHAGEIYVRPQGHIQTRVPQSAHELDEVIDLAAEKRALHLLEQTRRLHNIMDTNAAENSSKRYTEELGEASFL